MLVDGQSHFFATIRQKQRELIQRSVTHCAQPLTRKYTVHGRYAGVTLFWRELGKPPISPETVAAIDELHPFFEFLLTDLTCRMDAEDPMFKAYFEAMAQAASQGQLTPQENRVAALLLKGHSYREIGQIMRWSMSCVRKYTGNVYLKLHVRSHIQMIMRYLTFRAQGRGMRGN